MLHLITTRKPFIPIRLVAIFWMALFGLPLLKAEDWITSKEGAKVWKSNLLQNETCTWSGQVDESGYANGPGMIIWSVGGELYRVDVCHLKAGRLDGVYIFTDPSGFVRTLNAGKDGLTPCRLMLVQFRESSFSHESEKANWIKSKEGVWLRNENPEPEESCSWTGSKDKDGFAQGPGLVIWYQGSKLTSVYSSVRVAGRLDGLSTAFYPDGGLAVQIYNETGLSGRVNWIVIQPCTQACPFGCDEAALQRARTEAANVQQEYNESQGLGRYAKLSFRERYLLNYRLAQAQFLAANYTEVEEIASRLAYLSDGEGPDVKSEFFKEEDSNGERIIVNLPNDLKDIRAASRMLLANCELRDSDQRICQNNMEGGGKVLSRAIDKMDSAIKDVSDSARKRGMLLQRGYARIRLAYLVNKSSILTEGNADLKEALSISKSLSQK